MHQFNKIANTSIAPELFFFLSHAEATMRTETGKLPRNTSYNFDLQNRYIIKKHSVGIELRIKMLTIL